MTEPRTAVESQRLWLEAIGGGTSHPEGWYKGLPGCNRYMMEAIAEPWPERETLPFADPDSPEAE